MINVFISHSHKDKRVARILAKKLNQYGIYAWIDEAEIKIGDSLIEKIREGLDKVDYLIALISENSVESEWVKKELDIAMNREIESKRVVVIPILTGKCELPGFLKGKLYADMTSNRKIIENFPLLLSRFNIGYVDEIKECFTEFGLNVTEIISKLENGCDLEKIELLENITYQDSDLFKINTFVNCINNLLTDHNENIDLILSVLEACSYCPSENFINLKLKFLLDSFSNEIVIQTIEVAQTKKTLKLFDKKVFSLLVDDNANTKLKDIILKYFIDKSVDSKLASKICNYGIEHVTIENSRENLLLIKLLCKFIDVGYIDEIIDIISKNYNLLEENNRKSIIYDLCRFGIHTFYFYIDNPRIRENLKQILTQTILESDDEKVKSTVCLFLLIQDNNLIESRQHIWDLVHKLDDYSLEMLFSELDIEYNISYIFSSDIDVRGFAKCINRNPNIKDLVENIISQIHLKSAIEIIETHSIIPQRNADDILFTLLKETDIAEHTALLADIDEKISNSTFKSDLDNILLGVAKYRANDSIEHLINSLDFEIKKSNMELTYNRNKIKLIVEELNDIQYKIEKNNKIKIQEFLKKIKPFSGEII